MTQVKLNKVRTNSRLLSLFGALVAALALLVVSACESDEPRTAEGEQAQEEGGTAEGQAPGEKGAELGEIEDEPAEMMGKEVVISGEIEEMRTNRAFVVESGGFLGLFEDEMLVLTRSPIELTGGQTLSEGNDVRVRGTVERLVVADIEKELGWDLDQELEVEFRDKPIIIGNAVWLMEQKGMWTEGQKKERATLDKPQPSQPTEQ